MKLGPGEKTILLLGGFVVVVAGVRAAGPLLMPLFLAIVIASVSVPVVRLLEKIRVPHVLAIVLAVVLDLSVLAGMLSIVGTSVSEFYKALPRYQDRIGAVLREAIAWLELHGIHFSKQFDEQVSSLGNLMGLVGTLLSSVMSAVTTSLFVLLLVVFILFEISRWRLKIRYAMGDPHADLRKFATAARELQKYLFIKTGMNLVTGVLCTCWCAIMGLDFPVLWGLIAFLLNYIPTIGSVLAGVPPVVLAWVQFGPGAALATAIGYLILNSLLGNVIEPRLMGRALGLSPLVVLVSMVFWWWLWGPVGALLSAPLTMGVKIAAAQTKDLRWVAILLGSARWVEEKHAEWTKARPVLTPRPGQFCQQAGVGGNGGSDMIRISKPHEDIDALPDAETFVSIEDSSPPKSIRPGSNK